MDKLHDSEDLTTFRVVQLPAEPGYIAYTKDGYAPMALNIPYNMEVVRRSEAKAKREGKRHA